MIDTAIAHIAAQLNQYLRRSFELTEDVVVVSNIHEQDGTISPNVNNKLVVFLTNIEKDTLAIAGARAQVPGAARDVSTARRLHLNLYVMIAGYFAGNNYPEALKFVSHAVRFFQMNPVLDHSNTPELDSRIDRLVLDIENLDIRDLSNLWGILSGKYLPSVLYKVRLVAVDSDAVVSEPFRVLEGRGKVST